METEAYSWKERGCHAWQNKITARNATMFKEGGVAYIYLCYGIHNMLNVVTGREGQAEAVLIRALQPVQGLDVMMRRAHTKTERRITSGPGKLTRALGIQTSLDETDLLLKKSPIQILEGTEKPRRTEIVACPRIGIQYAGEDALLPWRFFLKDNPWVSVQSLH